MDGGAIAAIIIVMILIVIGVPTAYFVYKKRFASDLNDYTKSPFITTEHSLTGGKSFF